MKLVESLLKKEYVVLPILRPLLLMERENLLPREKELVLDTVVKTGSILSYVVVEWRRDGLEQYMMNLRPDGDDHSSN